jgi:hypothetical protein
MSRIAPGLHRPGPPRPRSALALAVVVLVTGCVTDIGAGDGSAATASFAYGISDDGTVVGSSGDKAFVGPPGGDLAILAQPEFPGTTLPVGAVARARNASGTVVGHSYFPGADLPSIRLGIIWSPAGTFTPSGAADGPGLDVMVRLSAAHRSIR